MKRIRWLSFFCFFLVVGILAGFSCVLHNAPTEYPLPPANYYLIIFGVFGTWLSIVSVGEVGEYPFKQSAVLSHILIVCGGLGFFGGVIVGVAGAIGSNRPWAEILYQFFWFYIFLVAVQLVVWVIISQCIVPPGTMVVGENLVMKPGRKYRVWPFMNYDLTTIKETTTVILSDFVFTCRDGTFVADCKASVLLGIDEMRPGRFFYQKNFGNIFDANLKKFMDGTIAQLTSRETLGQVIRAGEKGFTESAPLGNLDVCGLKIPLYWGGKIKLSNIKTH